jgi:hypothetical protein
MSIKYNWTTHIIAPLNMVPFFEAKTGKVNEFFKATTMMNPCETRLWTDQVNEKIMMKMKDLLWNYEAKLVSP